MILREIMGGKGTSLSESQIKRIIFIALITVFLLGFFVRLFPIRTAFHYWDETVYLQHAKIISGGYDNYNELDFRPLLLPVIISAGYVFTKSLIMAHFLVALLASLGILAIFLLAKELFNDRVALISSLVYAILPLNLLLAHDILVDSILPTFLIVTLFFAVKAFRGEKTRHYVLAAVFLALSILLKFTSLTFVFVLLIALYAVKRGSKESILKAIKGLNWKGIAIGSAAFFATMAPYLIFSQIKYGFFLYTFIKANVIIGWDTFIPLKDMIRESPKLFPPILAALGLFGLIPILKRKKMQMGEIVVLGAIAIILGLTATVPHKELRYFMPLTPFLAMFSAKGIYTLAKVKNIQVKAILMLILIAILASNVSDLGELHTVKNLEYKKFIIGDDVPPIMASSLWIRDNTPQEAMVYSNFNWPVIAYYSERKLELLPLFKPFESNISEVMRLPGYLFISEESKDREPKLSFAMNDKRFDLIETFGEGQEKVYVFNYSE